MQLGFANLPMPNEADLAEMLQEAEGQPIKKTKTSATTPWGNANKSQQKTSPPLHNPRVNFVNFDSPGKLVVIGFIRKAQAQVSVRMCCLDSAATKTKAATPSQSTKTKTKKASSSTKSSKPKSGAPQQQNRPLASPPASRPPLSTTAKKISKKKSTSVARTTAQLGDPWRRLPKSVIEAVNLDEAERVAQVFFFMGHLSKLGFR